jgi:hypothetical protein
MMSYAVVRKDLERDETEAFYGILTGQNAQSCLDASSKTIPDSAYPIRVLHQDDNGLVYLLLNNEAVVAQSIDFDFTEEYKGGE